MTSLRSLLESVREGDGGWVLDQAEGWTQGRTLFGGLTAALGAGGLCGTGRHTGSGRGA